MCVLHPLKGESLTRSWMNLALLGERKQLLRPEGFISGEEDTELIPTASLMPAKAKHEVAGLEQGPEEPGL